MRDPNDTTVPTGVRRWTEITLLAAGGFGLGLAPLEVFPGIHFVFGGAFALVAALRSGPVAGGLVGFVAALPTWSLWNQPAPLSAILYCLEGVWVGLAVRHGRFGVLAGSLSYWLLAGSWLNLLLQIGVFGLPFEIAFIIQCRSLINGLLVAMAVELGELVVRMRRPSSVRAVRGTRLPRLRVVLTLVITALITLPILWITVRDAHRFAEQRVADLERSVEQELAGIRSELAALAKTYSRGVGLAAEVLSRRPDAGSAFMQELLEIVQAQYPEFAGLYVADEEATTLAFVPLYNERGEHLVGRSYRDRRYFRELVERRDIVYSGVYQARGGMSEPAVAIGAPVSGPDGELDSFVLGWFDVERSFGRLAQRFDTEGKVVLIADRRGGIIADSRIEPGGYQAVRRLPSAGDAWVRDAVDGATLLVEADGARREPPALVASEGASILAAATEPTTGWRILIRQSLAPIRTAMVRSATAHLLVLIGAVLLALLLANVLARLVTSPLEKLRLSAERLAAGDLSARPPDGVVLGTVEIDSLLRSFSRMVERLDRSWTRQEQLLDEVTVTKRELEATFDAMTDALVITDVRDRVVRANRAFHELSGLDPSSTRGESLGDLLHPDGGAESCHVCAERQVGHSGAWRVPRHHGGRRCTLEIRVDQLRAGGGEIVGAVQLVRDVTEAQAAEAKHRQNDKLRALGQLAAGVAHNFNNLLTSILGYTQLARLEADDPAVDRPLATVEIAATDAAAMVRRIQRFARSEEDGESMRPVSLRSVLEDAVDLTRARWENDAQVAGARYAVRLRSGPDAEITGSPSALREVFVNLINNALDAMPRGGTLELETDVEDGMAVAVVRDEGAGMTDAVRERVFEPFFTTKGPDGQGLGLAMSYGTVQRHEGRIHVASHPGEGTEVRVHLPLHDRERPVSSPSPEALDASGPAGEKSSRSILLVEDEEPIRRLFTALLSREGHEVEAVGDGEAALDRLQVRSYDLVVTDLALPGVDGTAVAEAVRRNGSDTRVLLVTGYGGSDVVEKGGWDFSPSVDAWLSKPVDTAIFLETVAGLVAPGAAPLGADRPLRTGDSA